MSRKIFSLLFVVTAFSSFSQTVTDSITRKPPLRGKFRWIINNDMYEEGQIHNNIKIGEWNNFYKGGLSGKTIFIKGLAVAEFWNYKDTLKLRYELSKSLDSMTIFNYDLDGKLVNTIKYFVDVKTFFLNYSLMTEDTVFKKIPVTKTEYDYHPWKHRDDVVSVREETGGIVNMKYFFVEGKNRVLKFEINDKGDVISGNKKDFHKEIEKQKKFIEEEQKKNTPK